MMYRKTSVKRTQKMIALYSKRTVPDGQTQAAVANSTILTTVEIIPVGIIIMCRMILPEAIRLVEIIPVGIIIHVPDDTTGAIRPV
mgnify:CR=1 FL=1